MEHLLIDLGTKEEYNLDINPDKIHKIGRSQKCDIQINSRADQREEYISRVNTLLRWRPDAKERRGAFEIRDDSRNGTRINGEDIGGFNTSYLNKEDVISIGYEEEPIEFKYTHKRPMSDIGEHLTMADPVPYTE